MDRSGLIGLTWLVIGIGLPLHTIHSLRHQPHPEQNDLEVAGSRFPLKRPLLPLLPVAAGIALLPRGMGFLGSISLKPRR